MNSKPLLTSNIRRMLGWQRVPCVLELGEDKIVRIYSRSDNTLLCEAPASSITYSAASIVKARLRLVAPNWAVRIGIWSINVDKSALSPTTHQSARDFWITTLKEYGASEDPKQPEAKLDTYGMWALAFCLTLLGLVTILVITIR